MMRDGFGLNVLVFILLAAVAALLGWKYYWYEWDKRQAEIIERSTQQYVHEEERQPKKSFRQQPIEEIPTDFPDKQQLSMKDAEAITRQQVELLEESDQIKKDIQKALCIEGHVGECEACCGAKIPLRK